jgi:hypothetical protein
VGEERDLSLETVEGSVLERTAHEICADEERHGHGGEDRGSDGEAQTRLE